ncbi:hypothetical protein ABIE89_000244 [Bradyrhizobium niftali]|uniref:hypothetical protein n=1 Tax=Bradyrhizobium niftali TaxID=2560055 RepID=UPI00383995B6
MESSTSPRNEVNEVNEAKGAAAKIAAGRASKKNDRPWTAVERHKLRGLVEREMRASTIARSLKRSLASITAMAASLGLPLKRE